MTWQQFKSRGEPIYELRHGPLRIEMKKIRRVVLSSSTFQFGSGKSVRYNNRYYELHDQKDLKTKYRQHDGTFLDAFLDGRAFTRDEEQLPFIRLWDQPRGFYPTFG
jgi:hypothetical protein